MDKDKDKVQTVIATDLLGQHVRCSPLDGPSFNGIIRGVIANAENKYATPAVFVIVESEASGQMLPTPIGRILTIPKEST